MIRRSSGRDARRRADRVEEPDIIVLAGPIGFVPAASASVTASMSDTSPTPVGAGTNGTLGLDLILRPRPAPRRIR